MAPVTNDRSFWARKRAATTNRRACRSASGGSASFHGAASGLPVGSSRNGRFGSPIHEQVRLRSLRARPQASAVLHKHLHAMAAGVGMMHDVGHDDAGSRQALVDSVCTRLHRDQARWLLLRKAGDINRRLPSWPICTTRGFACSRIRLDWHHGDINASPDRVRAAIWRASAAQRVQVNPSSCGKLFARLPDIMEIVDLGLKGVE